MSGDLWPMLRFGPVNLWTVISAVMFYSSREEQKEMVWRDREYGRFAPRTGVAAVNNPACGRISALLAKR